MLFLRSLNYFLKGNCKIRLLHTLASNLDKFSELTLIRVALEKKLQLLYNITPLYSTSPPRHLNIMLKVFVSLSLAASITVLPERGGGEGGGGRGREICLGYLMLIHLSPSVLWKEGGGGVVGRGGWWGGGWWKMNAVVRMQNTCSPDIGHMVDISHPAPLPGIPPPL